MLHHHSLVLDWDEPGTNLAPIVRFDQPEMSRHSEVDRIPRQGHFETVREPLRANRSRDIRGGRGHCLLGFGLFVRNAPGKNRTWTPVHETDLGGRARDWVESRASLSPCAVGLVAVELVVCPAEAEANVGC
jgi:hypothetical protein